MSTHGPEPLILPWGIQFPQEHECPPGEYREILEAIMTANVTTGYVRLEGREGYRALYEINAHAPHLFSLFRALTNAIIPGIAAPLIGTKDNKTVPGPYTDRDLVLELFEAHNKELVYDGFLEFGILYADGENIEEVFLTTKKFLQVWTNKPQVVEDILSHFRIPFFPELQFIDDYPTVSHSKPDAHGSPQWQSTYTAIMREFESLPQPAGEV